MQERAFVAPFTSKTKYCQDHIEKYDGKVIN
jgi:hypothetical protein